MPFPPAGDLPDAGTEHKALVSSALAGTEHKALVSSALAGRFFTTEPPGKPIEK